LDDLPETADEREAVQTAKAGNRFVSGAEVSKYIAQRNAR
jgi:hypothetical protein